MKGYFEESLEKLPGAKTANDEFFANKPVETFRDQVYGKYYAVKPIV